MNNTAQQTKQDFYVGQPVYHTRTGETGYITNIQKSTGSQFLMIGGPSSMAAINFKLSIVWDNGTIANDIDEYTAQKWVDYADNMQLSAISEAEAATMLKAAQDKAEAEHIERIKKRDEYAAKVTAWRDLHADKVPSWAKAVIIAERIADESDLMSDYHGGRTEETIILGFSKHTRDLFDEMRKYCAHVPEVQHLAVKPEKPEGADEYWTPKDEHREKYSMGGGYYLKDGYRYSNGWKVSKRTFYNADKYNRLIDCLPYGRWEVVDLTSRKPANKQQSVSTGSHTAHIEQHEHTKKGFMMFMVVLDRRVERDEFNELRAQAQELGGWYSRQWGKTPGGFAFKDQETAEQFLTMIADGPTDEPPKPKGSADKLRKLADSIQSTIDNKLADRETNTPKRLAQANHARLEGYRWERTQKALYAMADLIESDSLPSELAELNSKKAVFDLLAEETAEVCNGYHGYRVGTGKIHRMFADNVQAVALWSLIGEKSEEQKKADEIKRKIETLSFSNIPGFFPTPEKVIDLMLDYVDIKEHDNILEPNIGSAAIADGIVKRYPFTKNYINGWEVNPTLAEIARSKGYHVNHGDFMECDHFNEYDVILMNPPFEKGQDIDHVLHAYKMLKPGKRMASVMSASVKFNSTAKFSGFREWVDSLGGEFVDLPEGSFKESGTAVNTCLLIIDKE